MRVARLWLAAGMAWAGASALTLDWNDPGAGMRDGAPPSSPVHWFGRVASGATPMFNRSTQVVLFTPATPDPLVARIEAELSAVGIAVRRIALPPDGRLDAVITREIAAGASAAIRIIPRSRGTEVWTGDTTARMSSRRSVKPDTSDAALSVIALRTVEFLRASLLDFKRRTTGNGNTVSTGTATGNNRTGGPASKSAAAERQPSTTGARQGSAGPASAARESPPQPARSPTVVDDAGGTTASSPSTAPTRASDSAQNRPADSSAPMSTPTPTPTSTSTSTTADVEPDQRSLSDTKISPREQQPEPEPDAPRRPAQGKKSTPTLMGSRPRRGGVVVDGFAIVAAAAILTSPGATAPIGAVAAIGRAPLKGRLGIELMAVLPVVPIDKKTADGSVQISVALFGAAANFRLTPATSPWMVDVALGGSATMHRSAARATGSFGNTPNAGSTEILWRATGHARLGAGYHVTEWLALRLDVLGGVVASQILVGTLHSDTTGMVDPTKLDDFGSWGPLFAGGALGFQADW